MLVLGERCFMNALASGASAPNSSLREVGSNRLQPATVKDIYRKRICLSAPIWASLMALGVAETATSVSCLALFLCQCNPCSGRAAGATFVNQLGLTAINVHLGNMILAFGWASFALSPSRQSVSAPWGTGGRISPADVREWKNAVTNANGRGSSARSGTGFAGRLGGALLGTTHRGHEGVVKILLERQEVNSEKPEFWGRTPLSLAEWEIHAL
ncbi:hypothetical protein B9Z19DRAFT_1134141 [Tuber borchii]|uniref:Uncharacterized protein n=1 Tax=Tuber borchii TaxID=42251 RepID=A0A2T6ZEK3_TUBBO|nr:hypothetical protein B9Z19DRAFT_1134141 [Tuber borchii]